MACLVLTLMVIVRTIRIIRMVTVRMAMATVTVIVTVVLAMVVVLLICLVRGKVDLIMLYGAEWQLSNIALDK